MEHNVSCQIIIFQFIPSSEAANYLQEQGRVRATLSAFLVECMFITTEPRKSLEQLGTGRESYFH